MFVRLAPVALVLALSTVVACGDSATPGSQGQGQDLSSGSGSNGSSNSGESKGASADDADGGAASTTSSGKGGDTSGKGSGDTAPPDPACVATCNSSLKAKCQGDDNFCPDLCGWASAAEVSCLVAAPNCEKSAYIACESQDTGGGSK